MRLPAPYYDDGQGIVIYHCDCRDILPHLPKVDLVLTDPPYGVGLQYESYEDTSQNWLDSREVMEGLINTTREVFMTPGIRNLGSDPHPRWVLCWAKPGSTKRNDTGGFNSWEPILYYGPNKIMTDYIYLPDCMNHSDFDVHPSPKPQRLFSWLVDMVEADTLLDPFMGSGTTLRAAKDLGRKAIGIEREERYCEIAVRRLAQEVLPLT
jgi:DNA modification methylase